MCASILSLYSTFQIRRPSTVSVNRRGSISNLFNKTVMRRKSSVVHMFTLIMHKTIYYQERGVGIGVPLTGLTPPHFDVCPNTGPGFSTLYVVVFLCSDER